MRVLIATLLLPLATLSAIAAPADDIAARLGARLEQTPVLRAEFVQTKELAAFKKPIVTRGHLVFARRDGVLWQIEQPLTLTYVMTETRIGEIGEDGQMQMRSVQEVPAMAQVGRILRALLGAQLGPLREWFDATAEGDEKRWTMTLLPKSSQVGQFIRRVTLSGGIAVEALNIEEAGGDTTRIRFRNTIESKSLSNEERTLFEARAGGR
ncbi:MAG TPA: outer membrane lipoprotein carrier protein LolA [Rhodocyclaceae bacterium]|nr:outer membrane lipoprotein carrier protein LolA [Rhodocyclaceae bacterium]